MRGWGSSVTLAIKRGCPTCGMAAKDIEIYEGEGDVECPNCGTWARSVKDWNDRKYTSDNYAE